MLPHHHIVHRPDRQDKDLLSNQFSDEYNEYVRNRWETIMTEEGSKYNLDEEMIRSAFIDFDEGVVVKDVWDYFGMYVYITKRMDPNFIPMAYCGSRYWGFINDKRYRSYSRILKINKKQRIEFAETMRAYVKGGRTYSTDDLIELFKCGNMNFLLLDLDAIEGIADFIFDNRASLIK